MTLRRNSLNLRLAHNVLGYQVTVGQRLDTLEKQLAWVVKAIGELKEALTL
jgi:hypothetical protein